MLNKLRGLLPNGLRKRVLAPIRRHVGGAFSSIGDRILGVRDPLVPPISKNITGYGNFRAIGYKMVILMIRLAGLRPEHRILDIGCGMGRVAIGLLDYLDDDAEYFGVDVDPNNIAWCRAKIAPRNANFHFEHIDIHNKDNNPRGAIAGTDFRSPLPDDSVDMVILTSVFTHLMPDVTLTYLEEISRVLRPGGKLFGTWFLYRDDESSPEVLERMDAEIPYRDPAWPMARYKYRDNPEATIAFELDWLLDQARQRGLELHGESYFGGWAGSARSRVPLGQDLLILERR